MAAQVWPAAGVPGGRPGCVVSTRRGRAEEHPRAARLPHGAGAPALMRRRVMRRSPSNLPSAAIDDISLSVLWTPMVRPWRAMLTSLVLATPLSAQGLNVVGKRAVVYTTAD